MVLILVLPFCQVSSLGKSLAFYLFADGRVVLYPRLFCAAMPPVVLYRRAIDMFLAAGLFCVTEFFLAAGLGITQLLIFD